MKKARNKCKREKRLGNKDLKKLKRKRQPKRNKIILRNLQRSNNFLI